MLHIKTATLYYHNLIGLVLLIRLGDTNRTLRRSPCSRLQSLTAPDERSPARTQSCPRCLPGASRVTSSERVWCQRGRARDRAVYLRLLLQATRRWRLRMQLKLHLMSILTLFFKVNIRMKANMCLYQRRRRSAIYHHPLR